MNTKTIRLLLIMCSVVCPLHAAEANKDSSRWKIFQAKTALNGDGRERVESENTILLDTDTGKSWMLWTTDTGYCWVELPMVKEFPKQEPLPDKQRKEAEQDGDDDAE